MTIARSHLTTLLALAVALIFPSCIEIEQDIWIKGDGSGTAKMKMGLSKQMLTMGAGMSPAGAGEDPFDIIEIEKAIEKDENIVASEIRKEETDTFKYLIIDLELADITKIGDALKSMVPDTPGGGADSGHFEIEKTDRGTYQITADMASPPSPTSDDPASLMAAGMIKGMLGDAKYVFRVHNEPTADDAHNGKAGEGVVVWTIPLAELMGGNAKAIEGEFFAAKLSSSGNLIFWLIFAVVLLAAGVLFFVFRAQGPKLT